MKNKRLEIVDELTIDENGNISAWLCALRDMELSDEALGPCVAADNGCPRGFQEQFH